MSKEEGHKLHDKYEITYYDLLKNIYEGRISLIRELERVFGKENVHKAVEEFYAKRSTESCTARMEKLENKPETIEELRDFLKSTKENDFSKQTQSDVWPEQKEDKIEFHTTECLWADIFRELDASDLGEIMLCKTDFVTAPCFHPKLRLNRTRTLMAGDEYCGFLYTLENESEKLDKCFTIIHRSKSSLQFEAEHHVYYPHLEHQGYSYHISES